VVDGRQKDLSDGLTLNELGQELLKLGVKDAVNLDGGASSEMIIDGKIVNSPSAGRERMLPSGFIIKSATD
jgi:exopolysaccharide biosynthesis protein